MKKREKEGNKYSGWLVVGWWLVGCWLVGGWLVEEKGRRTA